MPRRARARRRGRPGRRASTCCSRGALVDVAAGRRRATSRSTAPTTAACTPAPCSSTSATRPTQIYGADGPHHRRRDVLRAARAASSREVIREWFPMARAPAGGAVPRPAATPQPVIGQRERLLALGTLSAGLTHELNNPAAAAGRAAHDAARPGRRHAAQAGDDRRRLAGPRRSSRRSSRAAGRVRRAGSPRAGPHRRCRPPTPRTSSTDWLDDHGVTDGWELAPTFVAAGLERRRPGGRARRVPGLPASRARCAGWPTRSRPSCCSARSPTPRPRISTLVDAAKQYSQMDRAPHQWLDIHEACSRTLTMLSRSSAAGHSGQGLRQVAAADPRLRRRAEPGVDQPHRQRPRRHGRLAAR